jgi:DNA-binding MarR family transcriptional regulator
MNSQLTLASLVLAVFDLVRLGLPADPDRLAGRLGIEISRVERALAELERRGLADAGRARLTLAGLALASQLDMERSARLFGLAPANDAPAVSQRVA